MRGDGKIYLWRKSNKKEMLFQVCQLQLKICSKLIELATPSSSSSPPSAPTTAVSRCSTIKPSTLKRLAGRSVLGHSGRCPNGLARILRPKAQFNDDDGLFYYQVLPNELIKFLQDGATDCDWYRVFHATAVKTYKGGSIRYVKHNGKLQI